MAIPILNQREYCKQVDLSEPLEHAGLDRHIAALFCSQDDQALNAKEPQEVLRADPRGARTPSQMVEQKLQVLLGRRYQGPVRDTVGRLGNSRKVPGR